ncbi:hypothetical protein AMS68_000672 [Peltaster fructicola]|uniref:ABC transporter n=1 Tax=Peltaster fructicola TaxID=286661 RepID=A0A6H0XKK3_9PEZI|nr:hypothetical protein AMS68_000672 [Peltaster fructicola]
MKPLVDDDLSTHASQNARHASIMPGRDSVALSVVETRALQDPVPDSARPREFSNAPQSLPARVRKQIIEFNPLKSPFLELYSDLEHIQDKTLAVVGALLAIAAGVPLPIIFVVFSKIIDSFPPSEEDLRQRISQLLGVAVAYFVVTTGYTCAFSRVGERIAFTTRERLLQCLLKLDQEYFDTNDLDVTGLLTSKVETIQVGTSEKAGIFLQSLSYFVAAFVVGFILNAELTGILLAAVIPLTIFIVAFGSSWTSKLSASAAEHTETASGIAEAALRAVRVIQAFDLGEKICQQYSSSLGKATVIIVRKQIISACMLGCIYFVAYAANGLAFYVGSILSASGGNSQAGTIYAVCLLILDASFIVGQFAPFLNIFANAASSGQEIRALVKESKRQQAAASIGRPKGTANIAGCSIQAQGVTFAYPARPTQKVLKDVVIKFQPGQLNAVVGTSGGGKSTLISLLLGVYTKYTGTIMVGQQSLEDIDVSCLRSQISIVDQECVLFSGSIYDNICYGLAGSSVAEDERRARCYEAVQAAGVDFLERLPKGLDTVVDNSLQLSGGQKQRICLARALIKRPAVLILDEPTSALDANSEALVAKTVKRVAEAGTLVIMIAHRLSTVLDADTVFVFDDGKVAESGSPAELIVPGTIFYALLESQYAGQIPTESEDTKHSVDIKAEELELAAFDDSEDEVTPPRQEKKHVKTHSLRRALGTLLEPDRSFIAVGLFFSTVTGCMIIGEAIAFGNLVELLNGASGGSPDRSGINFYCLIFFILACIALVSYSSSGSSFGVASTRFTERVQTRMLRNLLRQDMEWFSSPGHSVHGLMARLSTDTGNLSGLSGVALGTIFSITASMLGGIILSFIIAWRITIVLICCVPVLALAGYARVRILAKSEDNQRNAYNSAAGIAAESCRSIRTVATLGLQDIVMQRYRAALETPYKNRLRITISTNALLAFSFAITYFVYALAYWWGATNVRQGYYAAREFFIVLPALLFSAQSAGQAFSLSPEITKAKSAAKSVAALLNAQPSILVQSMPTKSDSASTLSIRPNLKAAQVAKIEFKEVTMRYKENGALALNGVSLTIDNGETVALVGPSGAGKSTIVALLERFYDAADGVLLIDGVNIRELDPTILRSKIGLVPQDPQFFPGSIRANLTMSLAGNSQDTFAKVEQACKSCGLHDFISSLPDAYDTECSSATSTKLSGGQQQRLSIARAISRDPEILLLDEPTSALDAHSERDVQNALNNASDGRTTIIVAHRLASIQHVDKIIVFDHGRIAEVGKHADLMLKGGLYASMAKAQSLS